MLSSIPSLLLSNKALNHALNDVISAWDRSERACATVSVLRKNAAETVRPFLVISLFSNCGYHSFKHMRILEDGANPGWPNKP